MVLGGRKVVVANECPKHIMPEPLMLIAIAVVDLESFAEREQASNKRKNVLT